MKTAIIANNAVLLRQSNKNVKVINKAIIKKDCNKFCKKKMKKLRNYT